MQPLINSIYEDNGVNLTTPERSYGFHKKGPTLCSFEEHYDKWKDKKYPFMGTIIRNIPDYKRKELWRHLCNENNTYCQSNIRRMTFETDNIVMYEDETHLCLLPFIEYMEKCVSKTYPKYSMRRGKNIECFLSKSRYKYETKQPQFTINHPPPDIYNVKNVLYTFF